MARGTEMLQRRGRGAPKVPRDLQGHGDSRARIGRDKAGVLLPAPAVL